MARLAIFRALTACVLVSAASAHEPFGAAFTFQGRLLSDGKPINGPADLQFDLFDCESGGKEIGTVQLPLHPVENGMLTASLDFGAAPFATGRALFVGVAVNGTPLKQRMRLHSVPYSLATRGIDVAVDGGVSVRAPVRATVASGDALTVESSEPARQLGVNLAFAQDGVVKKRIGISSANDLQIFQGDGSNDSVANRVFATLRADTGELSLAKTSVPGLRITGGSDLSEGFDLSTPEVAAGTVLVIDAECPGRLTPCERAYDQRVAGVVSGAGGVRPGMVMGQAGSIADGAHPVALSGRVYVLCDATYAEICPGDRLTTSDTRGHAMAVRDADRAPGAVIGKAMSGLETGRGLVLMLVQPQ